MHETPQFSTARDRILQASIALFSREGYHQTGTRDIARLADVSEVTLFRSFETKEDLFLAALRASYQSLERHVRSLLKDAPTGSVEEVIPRIIGTFFDLMSLSPEVFRLSAVALFEVRGTAREECFTHLYPLATAVRAVITAKIEQGKMKPLNPTIATSAIALTAIAHAGMREFLEDRELARLSHRELVREYSNFWAEVLRSEKQESATSVEAH